MLSNSVAAAAWVRDCSAARRTSAPTGDAALDAVNTASAAITETPPVTSSAGTLLDQDGIAGTRERLDRIEARRGALTELNEREFAGNPARQRVNRTVIETDSARPSGGEGRGSPSSDSCEKMQPLVDTVHEDRALLEIDNALQHPDGGILGLRKQGRWVKESGEG